MPLEGSARRLTIFIGEADTYQHHSLATEIVQRAQQAGISGASVFRGVEGFGASNHVHTTRVLSLSNDLPLMIVIIDAAEHVDAFLPQVSELVGAGLVTVDDVHVVKYAGREPTP
jgi:hypothetical protein